MDERTLIFQKVQKGEMIFTLEKDRRSGYPIFDTARIVKVGESKPMASGAKDGFVNSVELVIQDSVYNSPYTCHHNLMKVFIMVYIILPM